jgi:Periplasmic binding protein-like domain
MALREKGVDVPAEMSLVGYDDHDALVMGTSPAVTSVRMPFYEMGTWAAERLFAHGVEGLPPRTLMACVPVLRESVAPPRLGGPCAADARFRARDRTTIPWDTSSSRDPSIPRRTRTAQLTVTSSVAADPGASAGTASVTCWVRGCPAASRPVAGRTWRLTISDLRRGEDGSRSVGEALPVVEGHRPDQLLLAGVHGDVPPRDTPHDGLDRGTLHSSSTR